MNSNEFEQWSSAHFAAFPETARWLAGTDDPRGTLAVWAKVMKDVDATAAIEVTERMARGDLEAPEAYNRERTAAVVRREANKINFHLQTRKQITYAEPRHRCPICQDTGSVTVWAKRSVEFTKEHGKAPQGRYVEAVACTCERGSSLANERSGPTGTWRSMPRYDEAFHCKTIFGTPGKADHENLIDWIGTGAGSGRYKEFDDWNEGANQ